MGPGFATGFMTEATNMMRDKDTRAREDAVRAAEVAQRDKEAQAARAHDISMVDVTINGQRKAARLKAADDAALVGRQAIALGVNADFVKQQMKDPELGILNLQAIIAKAATYNVSAAALGEATSSPQRDIGTVSDSLASSTTPTSPNPSDVMSALGVEKGSRITYADASGIIDTTIGIEVAKDKQQADAYVPSSNPVVKALATSASNNIKATQDQAGSGNKQIFMRDYGVKVMYNMLDSGITNDTLLKQYSQQASTAQALMGVTKYQGKEYDGIDSIAVDVNQSIDTFLNMASTQDATDENYLNAYKIAENFASQVAPDWLSPIAKELLRNPPKVYQ